MRYIVLTFLRTIAQPKQSRSLFVPVICIADETELDADYFLSALKNSSEAEAVTN